MFKFDLDDVVSEAVNFVSSRGKRVPVEEVAFHLAGKGFVLAANQDNSLNLEAASQILKSLVALSNSLDCRPGRSGGIGLPEWFKGGGSNSTPKQADKKVAKQLRDEFGLDRSTAQKVAVNYLTALATGKCQSQSLNEILNNFS
jgi:hypothetical protein